MTGVKREVQGDVSQGQALTQQPPPSDIPAGVTGPTQGPVVIGIRAVCRPLPLTARPDPLVRIAVPVGPLFSRTTTHCARVVARTSAISLNSVVSAVIGHVVALEARVRMIGPVRAVSRYARDEIAQTDDLRLTAAIALDDNAGLTLDLADAGNDDQLCETISRLMLPS